MNPDVTSLLIQLSELAVRNSAASVATRVRAIRKGKQLEAQVNELNELINELLEDRTQLVGLAQGFQDELVAQRISADDIKYVTEQLIPTAERLLDLSGDEGDPKAEEAIQAVKALVSEEMLTVLQLVGFNFKRAIGEPLTALVASLIAGVRPAAVDAETQRLVAQREVLWLQAA